MTLDRLYRDVENLKQQYRGLAGGPQLALSSIENGAIDSMDADGNLKMTIGQQDDGGNTINVISGPTPPTPVGFTVDVDHGKFIVHWSGDFDGEALAPSDWSRAEVHASQDPFFAPSRATARGSIVSAAGGEVTIGVLKGPWTIKMLAWSQAGRMSAPSAPVDVEVPGYGDIVLEEIDAATTLIKNAGEMLLEGQQTLADKLAGIADLDPEEISDEIAQARQEAIDAALAEIANVEGTLTSAIGGKSSTTWSTSNPPANYNGAVGDTWVKLTSLGSGGREIRRSRWQGDVWVDHPVDGAVLSNVDASTITTGFLDVVNRIRAGAILADKLLIGGARNLIPNGDLSQGNASLWPSPTNGTGPTYSATDKPEGFKGSVSYYSTGTISPTDFGRWSVNGMTDLAFEVWAKADKPDSRIYVEVRDQNGALLGSVSRTAFGAEGGWKGAPAAASYSYPVASYVVPTTWTKLRSTIKVPPETTEVYMARVYFNHSSGTERDAAISLSGMRLAPMVDGTLITPGGIQTPHLAADVLEVGNLKAGTAALAEAVIKKLFAEVVVARMAQAEEFIGENALLTNSVTAPKIVASEELWAKLGQFVKIRAEHIQSDAFDFMVARGGTYLTSGGNGSWSDNGLFISGPDGTSLVRFPTDGTPLSLTASDVQIDRASIGELDTTQQTVRSGGTLTLASGVTAPASPPELSAAWRRNVQLPRPAESSMDWTGLAYWKGMYVRGVNVLGSAGDSADRIEVYNPDGTLNKSIPIDLNPRAGVAVIGDIVYTIGPDHVASNAGKQWCHGFNLNTGERVSRWEYVNFYSPGQKKIAVGADGGNLMVAGIGGSPVTLYVFKYNPSTGAQVGTTLTAAFDTGKDAEVHGVEQSGGKIYVSPRGQVREYTVNGATLTKTAGFAWDNPNWNSGGFVIVDGRPIVVDTGAVYTGSTFNADTSLQVCYTWWNGSQETTPSPVADVALKARESVTVSMAKRAGLQKRIYVRTGTSGNWYRQVVGTDVTSLLISDLGAGGGWGTLFPLPTSNTFPASTPAVLKSAGGNFEARGDGSGRWGPLTFAANGTMTGIIPVAGGQAVITPTANSPTTVTVTLPQGRFTGSVAVTATAGSTVGGDVVKFVGVSEVSATSFKLTLHRTTGTATGVYWTAIGAD